MHSFQQLVIAEIEAARRKHKPINSPHEGFAVLWEEVDELWEEVRVKQSHHNYLAMLKELVQVAAMAQRMAEDCCLPRLPPTHP